MNKTQIDGASYFGYDALLLLARVLNQEELIEFIKYSNSKNIYPIVEVDCEEDLERVLKIGQTHRSAPTEKIVGVNLCVHPDVDFGIAINCRNLGTMEIDRKKHFSIIEKFNKKLEKTIIFAFSGIDDLEVIKEYKGIYNGVLVGSYFMEQFKK